MQTEQSLNKEHAIDLRNNAKMRQDKKENKRTERKKRTQER